jgi:hypothetical protein
LPILSIFENKSGWDKQLCQWNICYSHIPGSTIAIAMFQGWEPLSSKFCIRFIHRYLLPLLIVLLGSSSARAMAMPALSNR